MKQFSLALNLILLAAVVGLYFKVFSTDKKLAANTKLITKDTADDKTMHASIAYVELDSLNEKISFIKNKRQDLERKQKNIETAWKADMTVLQNRAAEFQKNAGAKTQQEAEKLQLELGQKQQQIEGRKQQQTQELSQESYTFLEDIQKKLKEYIKDYNSDKKYQYILTTGTGMDYLLYKEDAFNITNAVIEGMNLKLASKK